MNNFKKEYTFDQRKLESSRVLAKYPDRVPIICGKHEYAKVNEIDKNKYLVPYDLTCGQFVYVIRKRLHLPAEKAIFLFVNGTIPSSSKDLSSLYDEHKHLDGFMYITYSDENVFG